MEDDHVRRCPAAQQNGGTNGPRWANQRSSVRGLYRAMLGADAQPWRHRGDRQPSGPQSCRRQGCHRGRRRDVTVSAAVLAGPQPNRDAVQQIQSISAKGRRANCRWSMPSNTFVRANRQSRGMSKLLQTCWLCAHMTGICSKTRVIKVFAVGWGARWRRTVWEQREHIYWFNIPPDRQVQFERSSSPMVLNEG